MSSSSDMVDSSNCIVPDMTFQRCSNIAARSDTRLLVLAAQGRARAFKL